MMEHLSLVFFTLFAQVATGLAAVTGGTQLISKPASGNLRRSFTVALVVFAAAMLASMTHLGQPLRAFNVVFGLGHASALSLEIMAAGAFGAVLFAIVAILWTGKAQQFTNALSILVILLGLVLVKAIANVYTLPPVPAWDTWLTSLQFFQSMLALGSTLAALLLLNGCTNQQVGKIIGGAGIFALVLQVMEALLIDQHLNAHGLESSPVLQAILVIIGLLLWIPPVLKGRSHIVLSLAGLVSVAVGEVMARISFYDLLHYQVM